jgi:DNA-binding NtrC family response regulator
MTGAERPILVIEDEASVMAFVQTALERGGYPVVGVRSGALGLEKLATGEYAGVISDMRTPGGVSGQDVFSWIAHFRPELATHVMFITGDTVNQQTVEALETTGVPFLGKPFRVKELLELVRKVMGTTDGR